MQFHENLKRICNEKGTTPTAVLKDLGISTSKIAAWNKGSLPKQDMMVRLAEFLGCSVMDFFWDAEDDRRLASTSVQTSEPSNEDEEDILRLYRSLSRRDKHEFMTIIYDYGRRVETAGDNSKAGSSII